MNNDPKQELLNTFSREQVVEQFITFMSEQAERLFASAEESFRISAQMDGRMQSRYDTQKEDHAADGNMKLSIATKLKSRVQALTEMREQGIPELAERIEIFSLFQLEDKIYGGNEWFFLSDMVGGVNIEINGVKVYGLSPETPLGTNVMSKARGDMVKYYVDSEEQKFKILLLI